MSDPEGYARDIEQRAEKLYSSLYSQYADFKGSRIVEIGGTAAAARYYLSKSPSKYYLVNLGFDEQKRAVLRQWEDAGVVEYAQSTDTSIPLSDASVDIVISENSFEHFARYESMVAEIQRILRPGGILITKFSPLYYSPFGAHLYEAIKLPWLTLFCKEKSVEKMMRYELLRLGFPEVFEHQWEQYLSLNRLRPSQFVEPFRSDAWTATSVTSFPFSWSLKAIEPVRTLLTHGLTIVTRTKG